MFDKGKATIIENEVKRVGIFLAEEHKDFLADIQYKKYYYSSKGIRDAHIAELLNDGWQTGDYQKVHETLYTSAGKDESNIRVYTAYFENKIK